MPLTQDHLINGRGLEPIHETNGIGPIPLQKQLHQQQQQQRQQQHPQAMHTEAANLTQPSTPVPQGTASHQGTPYASPTPTPTPMHMQADPAPQMSLPPSQAQDSGRHLAMLTTNLQNTSLDLSHSQSQRSPLLNGRQDSTPHGTPHHTPIPSPTPGSFNSQNPAPNLPDQYHLQLIPESQFKQEVM